MATSPRLFPTPEQLRGCVYAGIIHGATGIVYFTWDAQASRNGGVIGMAPDPRATYTPRQADHAAQKSGSVSSWVSPALAHTNQDDIRGNSDRG
jgi:hypothetical protein